MSEEIAKQWLTNAVTTANNKNYSAHMDLISKRVSLTGVPGFESIGYDDWAAQCQHEFENNVLKSVRYDGLKLAASTDSRVMFKTFETVEATDGTINAQGIEVLLEKEDDGQWRLVQERVLADDETAFNKLLP
ncbi:MAG: hypothetical protein OQK73_11880 [Gammaproteobacteria bacterium]|nr:hypothetical protein [Gammaproteobacteria bacterium]